jgi:hypothetical protein
MGNWWIEKTEYRVVVTSDDGTEAVHEATFSDEHSPDPEVWAECSCGFSVNPRRNGALERLHEHFREVGAGEVKPIRTRSKSI